MGRFNAMKSLMFQTFIETILQLHSFMINPALRKIEVLLGHINDCIYIFVRLFCYKKFKTWTSQLCGLRFSVATSKIKARKMKKARKNKVAPTNIENLIAW